MINKDKLRKTILLLLLIPSIFTIELEKVNGLEESYSSGGHSSGGTEGSDGGGNSGGNGGGNSGPPAYGSKCDSVSCNVAHSFYIKQGVYVDIKKPDGTILKDAVFSPNFSDEFLAGTSVMLRVYEMQEFTTTASYSVSAKRQVWTCTVYKTVCDQVNKKGQCISTRKDIDAIYDSECSCPSGEPSFKGWKDVTSEYVASCSAQAVPEVISLTPTYIASYEDSNDIDAQPSNDKYYTAETIEGHECGNPVNGSSGGYNSGGYSGANTLSGKCSVSYDRIGNVCINVKKGVVRYISEAEECEEPDEYMVTPDKDGFWKYFIPLNANSDEDFVFTLNPTTGQKKHSGICQKYIDKYDNYAYIITDSNGNSFIGQNITKARAKQKVANGCYFQTTAVIPVIQKFYNELENGKNFKGFNFYYKPIDTENPFPNGLTNTSIWYDWNESDVKNPDLSDSYKGTPTYVAYTSGNENSIRQYNKLEEYTSWDNMYVSGVSKFIENENIIQRNVDRDSFYALGCGPKNSTNDVNNVFYQQECDIS